MDGKITLCMSEDCLDEINEVLRRPVVREKFPMLTDERVDLLIEWLRTYAEFVDPVEAHFEYPTDPKDEPYINLAIQAEALFLVSWDRHIKRLADPKIEEGMRFKERYPRVRILDPQEFLNHYYRDPKLAEDSTTPS